MDRCSLYLWQKGIDTAPSAAYKILSACLCRHRRSYGCLPRRHYRKSGVVCQCWREPL